MMKTLFGTGNWVDARRLEKERSGTCPVWGLVWFWLGLGVVFGVGSVGAQSVTINDLNPKQYWNTIYAQTQMGWSSNAIVETVFVEVGVGGMDWSYRDILTPLYQENIENGKPAIFFDGADEGLFAFDGATNYGFMSYPDSAFTWFVVLKQDNVGADTYQWIYDQGAAVGGRTLDIRWADTGWGGLNNSLMIRHRNNNSNISGPDEYNRMAENLMTENVIHSIVITFTPGDSMRVYVDGNWIKSLVANVIIASGSFTTGVPNWGRSGWGAGLDWDGWIFEGGMWNRVAGVDSIHQFIFDEYAIGLDLGLGGGNESQPTEIIRRGKLRTQAY